MKELKSSVMRKEGDLIKLTHVMEERNKQIKEKEEEAMFVITQEVSIIDILNLEVTEQQLKLLHAIPSSGS